MAKRIKTKKRKPKKIKKRIKKRLVKKKKKVSKKKKTKKDRKRRKAKISARSEEFLHKARIRIIGIGGGGGSIVSEIARLASEAKQTSQVKKVDFIIANTDLQALQSAPRHARVFHFGQTLTHGLGCGMDPKLGMRSAQKEREKIAKLFQGIDLCILVASLGGGTGSGASPEFVKIAKDSGTMTFGIFTLPFDFEGSKKTQIARNSLVKLTPNLNALAIIPNERIFQLIDKKTPLKDALSAINKILSESLGGLIEMIYLPGLINIDFADLKTILEDRGKLAYLNSVLAEGPDRAEAACREVLRSPLNEYSIQGAEKILFNITSAKDLGMREVEQISKTISDFNRRAKIIFGVSQDKKYNGKIRVTLLAIGCGKKEIPKKVNSTKPAKVSSKFRRANPAKKNPKRSSKPKPTRSSDRVPRRMTGQTKKPKKPKTKTKPKSKSKPKPKLKPKLKPKSKSRQKPGFQTKLKSKPKPRALPSKVRGKPKPKPKPKSKPKLSFTPLRKKGLKEAKNSSINPSSKASLGGKVKEKGEYKSSAENEIHSDQQILKRQPQNPNSDNLQRRNGLELKKQAEQVEEEIIAQEKKWDIPAFLRRKTEEK